MRDGSGNGLVSVKERVLAFLKERESEMIGLIGRVVGIDSGTGYVEGLNQVASMFRQALVDAGVPAEFVAAPGGNHVLGRVASRQPGGAVSLVVGHMDTVFPPGTVAERPFRVEGGRAYGPGVEDMKSGLVCAVYAAKALTELDLWPGHEVVFFFNSDEEIRSPSSAHVFAREGGRADECYVLEGARDDGSVVTARKGSARFRLTVAGRPSHSGANSPGRPERD